MIGLDLLGAARIGEAGEGWWRRNAKYLAGGAIGLVAIGLLVRGLARGATSEPTLNELYARKLALLARKRILDERMRLARGAQLAEVRRRA